MPYSNIDPPFSLDFQNMSKAELEAYAAWFHEVMPRRIEELSSWVRATPGFETWSPDGTPDSLARLGAWFEAQVETRRKSNADLEEERARLVFPIEAPEDELTSRTFSLAMDVGMYFGRVISESLPGTHWDQPLKNRKFVDYGQPVLMGFGTVPLNPVRIAVMLAYGISRRQQGGERLRGLFDTWAKMKKA